MESIRTVVRLSVASISIGLAPKRIRCFVLPVLVLTALLFVPLSASAGTIKVPGEQPTIQAGIDAAQNGDIVIVADDTYTGTDNKNLRFNGKAIRVRSSGGPSACTTLG